MSDIQFAVGDLVALSRSNDLLTGQPVVWRIAMREGDLFMLLPTNTDDPRPRSGTPATMTLVEAWSGASASILSALGPCFRRHCISPSAGRTTIAEVAAQRAARPEMPLWKPLNEFLDEFYDRPDGLMFAEEPTAPIVQTEGAYLAASVEYLCTVYALDAPDWVCDRKYFLRTAYYPECYGRAMEAIFIAESPVSFRRRFIFTEGRPLRRKNGPRFRSR